MDHTPSNTAPLCSDHTSSNTTPLCPACNRLLLSIQHAPNRFWQELGYHSSSRALVKSAGSCPLCAAFCQIRPQKDYLYANPTDVPCPKLRKRVGNINIMTVDELESHLRGAASIGTAMIAVLDREFGQCSDPSEDRAIWSAAQLNLENRTPTLLRWVMACASSHQKCKSTYAFQNPTRLLDLGSHESAAIDTIRLANSKTLQSDAKYTILSHCWGTSVSHGPLRTTVSTLDVHSAGIKVDALPKTFQDAVRLTRAISTRYIWIDSLCIIQDDPTDWENEAVKMATYFQNSVLTIAATSAVDSTTGCFLNIENTGLSQTITSSEPHRTVSIRPTLADRSNVIKSPLNKRGWVLQEIVLSTRVLHCAQDQWYWQCREHINSEDGTVTEPDFDFVTDDWPDWRQNPLDRQIIGQWNHLAVAYSKRTLTYDKDKLAAFAGITNYFQQRSNDEPILGAWKTTLAYDLHWSTTYDERDQAPPPKEDGIWLRLPSWSWMSTPSKIWAGILSRLSNRTGQELIPRATLVEWDITWSGPPMTSTLLSTRLVISAPLRPFGTLSIKEVYPVSGAFDRKQDKNPTEGVFLLLLYEHSFRASGEWVWEEAFLFVTVTQQEPLTCRRIGAGTRLHIQMRERHPTFRVLWNRKFISYNNLKKG